MYIKVFAILRVLNNLIGRWYIFGTTLHFKQKYKYIFNEFKAFENMQPTSCLWVE